MSKSLVKFCLSPKSLAQFLFESSKLGRVKYERHLNLKTMKYERHMRRHLHIERYSHISVSIEKTLKYDACIWMGERDD